MLDPGTALGLASLVWDVVKDLYTYYSVVADCGSDVKELRARLLRLQGIFQAVKLAHQRPVVAAELPKVPDADEATKQCEKAAESLKSELDKIRRECPDPNKALALEQKLTMGQKVKNLTSRLIYPVRLRLVTVPR
jgi:DNA repair exonuclease SbcCD ATPase subunit